MLKELTVSTSKNKEFVDITSEVEKAVKSAKVEEGICVVYVPHATASLAVNESGSSFVKEDVQSVLDKLIPAHQGYKHDKIDNNADAHIKATMLGPSITFIIKKGELALGTWQNIFLAEFDGPRERTVLVKVIKD